jgi:hypothetical protein
VTSEDINKLVLNANDHNSKNDLAGVLLFRGGIFLQLIEGDEKKLNELFEKIKTDSRHSNLVEIFNIPCKIRVFENWSMGYHEISEIDLKMINEMLS